VLKSQKARKIWGFSNSKQCLQTPKSHNYREKIPKVSDRFLNIPIFGRPSAETFFDPHCVVGAARPEAENRNDPQQPSHAGDRITFCHPMTRG